MSQAALTIDSNVTIRCFNQYGQVTRTSHVHNKATMSMVEGLLRFLCGDFNRTKFNDEESYITNNEADAYIPSEVRFGTVGVKMENRSSDYPQITNILSSEFKRPTFDEYKLQQEIDQSVFQFPFKFESLNITSFEDTNNSMGLSLRFYISPGKLDGRSNGDNEREYFIDNVVGDSKGWTYYDPTGGKDHNGEYEALFTEIGLYSGAGILLARVLLDGEVEIVDGHVTFKDDKNDLNPLIQSDSSSVVVEWKIGIVSIGQNDHIISSADITINETEG